MYYASTVNPTQNRPKLPMKMGLFCIGCVARADVLTCRRLTREKEVGLINKAMALRDFV